MLFPELPFLKPEKIILKHSGIEGRGVFAFDHIKKGEIIERCPLIQMEYRSKYQLDPTIFGYSYARYSTDHESEKHGFLMYIAAGYGMMYNHQDDSNALWKFNYDQLIGDVIAIQDIKKDAEIFVNYGNCYFNNENAYTGKEKIEK